MASWPLAAMRFSWARMCPGLRRSPVASVATLVTLDAMRGCLIVGLVAVGGDEVFLGMMVSRSAEITGVSGATLVSLDAMRGCLIALGTNVSRPAEITGCITCNACES